MRLDTLDIEERVTYRGIPCTVKAGGSLGYDIPAIVFVADDGTHLGSWQPRCGCRACFEATKANITLIPKYYRKAR